MNTTFLFLFCMLGFGTMLDNVQILKLVKEKI